MVKPQQKAFFQLHQLLFYLQLNNHAILGFGFTISFLEISFPSLITS